MKRLITKLLLVSGILAASAVLAAAAPTKVTLWSAISGVGQEGQTQLLASTTPIGRMDAALTGVDWDITWTQNSDWDTAFNLRLASNDFPEAIAGQGVFRQDHLARLVDAGVLVPLDKYYSNPKFPNIGLVRKNVINYWKHTDGHIYNFPTGVYQDENQPWGYWAAAVWTVRPDSLAAVGMKTSDLATLAGVEKFLRAVKAKNLQTSDGLPVYPISSGQDVSFREVIMNTFGVDTAGMGFQMVNGKLVNWRDNPQTKAAFKWLNSLWVDGIIDPEALSQKNDTLREKMMGKRVALMADWAWPFWQTVTAGKTAVTDMVLLPYPSVPGVAKPGINVTYNPNGSAYGLMITKNAKNPDLVAAFANEVWKDFDPKMDANAKWEHQLTLEYGTRGTMWDWDPKAGKPYYVTLGDMAAAAGDYNKLLGTGFQTNPMIVQGNDSNYFTSSLTDVLDWIFKMHKFYYNKPNVGPARVYDNIKVPADGLWNKNRDIIGKVDLEYWAKLVSAAKGTFDAVWTDYQNQLEQQGSWSQTRAEAIAAYKP
jgi:ABC-type glycerol-3-phosphate transport system substrate-binding protein